MTTPESRFIQDGLRFAGWMEPSSTSLRLHQASGRVTLTGDLITDYKGRWGDNTPVRTSYILEVLYVEEENLTVVNTRNSVYFVKKNLLSDYGLGTLTHVSGKALEEMVEAGEIEIEGTFW